MCVFQADASHARQNGGHEIFTDIHSSTRWKNWRSLPQPRHGNTKKKNACGAPGSRDVCAAQRCPALPRRLNLADRLPCDRKSEIARQRFIALAARAQACVPGVRSLLRTRRDTLGVLHLQIFRRARSLRSGYDKRRLHAHIPRRRAAAHNDCRNDACVKL